jgi:hypothetical protein
MIFSENRWPLLRPARFRLSRNLGEWRMASSEWGLIDHSPFAIRSWFLVLAMHFAPELFTLKKASPSAVTKNLLP